MRESDRSSVEERPVGSANAMDFPVKRLALDFQG
jgi:hypothetical protein